MRKLIGTEIIDLKLALMDSAQCFHWVSEGGAFGGFIAGTPVWLTSEGGSVYADSGDVDAIREYLDLNRDYSRLAEEYAEYPLAARAVGMYPGLRVLNQPTWETLVTFIISANNNVSRIRSLVNKLREYCGEERGGLYMFPTPERLAECEISELHAMGMGYRDKYLVETARAVAGGFPINELRGMEYAEAHRLLITLMGVGDKVADCVQLFGCGHSEAFPVDVWIERMCRAVFGMDIENRRALGAAAREMLGKNAGLLQQFLFHAARTGAIEV